MGHRHLSLIDDSPHALRCMADPWDELADVARVGGDTPDVAGTANRKKSGCFGNTRDVFTVDVAWPNVWLSVKDIGGKDYQVPYEKLDQRTLTLGELEIISSPHIGKVEREARTLLLKDILHYADIYEWGGVFYAYMLRSSLKSKWEKESGGTPQLELSKPFY